MKTKEILALYKKHVAPNYGRVPLAILSGKGSEVTDPEGKKYLDMAAGIAVNAIGHAPQAVVKALKQAAKLMHTSNLFYTLPQGLLARELTKLAFPSQALFVNSGAEAVESALKLARKYHHDKQTGRFEFISMLGSFHGRTYGALSATGQTKYQNGFAPLVPGFSHVPYNDFAALKKAVTPKTAAIIMEVLQGEGGVRLADKAFVRQARQLCDKEGILLIFDEVQTGFGRTGKWFGYQHHGVTPDIMTLAKGLGGGFPIGVMLAKPDIMAHFGPGTHASTFGGNPLACTASLAVLDSIKQKKLLAHVTKTGRHVFKRLNQLKTIAPTIREVRGMGLMIGIELDQPAAPVIAACRAKGLLIIGAGDNVLRMVPALNVTQKEMDKAIRILGEVLCTKTS